MHPRNCPFLPAVKASPGAAGHSKHHESARAQVAGAVDDIPEIKGTLYAAPVLSTVAHGKLLGMDTSAALAMPGVRDVLLTRDIPGDRFWRRSQGMSPSSPLIPCSTLAKWWAWWWPTR